VHNELFIAILSGLGGMFGWGLADFFAKKTIDQIGDVVTLFWSQFIGVFPLLILFLIHPSLPVLSKIEIPIIIFLGVWSGLSYIPTYTAFGKGKVSLLSPIFATYAVVVAILSAIFFKEVIPFGRQVAFAIVFIGIIIINGDPRNIWLMFFGKSRIKGEKIQGLKEILLAVCLYSLWIIAFDRFINGRDWVLFLLVVRIFSALALLVYLRAKNIKIKVVDKIIWKFLVLIGVFDVFAFASLSYGLSHTSHTSIVAMLGAVFSLPTIILARVFLKEKMTRTQTVGSIIIIIGIALISFL